MGLDRPERQFVQTVLQNFRRGSWKNKRGGGGGVPRLGQEQSITLINIFACVDRMGENGKVIKNRTKLNIKTRVYVV